MGSSVEVNGEWGDRCGPKTVTRMKSIAVVYGTVMGNAGACAHQLSAELTRVHLDHDVVRMSDLDRDQVADTDLLIVVVSTTGNGHPPHNATAFHNHLLKNRPDLRGLRFGVLALGSRRYPKFAECGKSFDRILGELGAVRVVERIDCDGDFRFPLRVFARNVLAHVDAHPELYAASRIEPDDAAANHPALQLA